MKKFLISAVSLVCIICAGCVQINFNLAVTSEGGVIRKWRFMGTTAFSQQIESIKARNEKEIPNVKVERIMAGDLYGYEFTVEYEDIKSFTESPSELYRANAGKNKGISCRKGWFFDEYDFDFYVKNPPANIPVGAVINETMFSEVIYDNVLNLPYSAERHNADSVTEGGKVLKWNLAPILIYGGEKYMNARFKIWHRDKVALTALAEVLLLMATIFFLIKARVEELESSSRDLRFKRNVFLCLFIGVGIITAYLILTPITFTDADIISIAR